MVHSETPTEFLGEEIPMHPDLVKGELENGLRYVIFPNKTPPNRFEAHLEVHAGSVDELPDQQGLAHLVEHVTFLGSGKREYLLGTGSRSNAYTDFHHTVFHVHCPLVNTATQKPMMPQVLDALKDIAFNPQFSVSRIEKERRAVLSEAQMMNTIDYRVSCQMLKYLHQENALGVRFPIGKTDQVKQWDREMIKKFWMTWYYPANMTLYIVGVLPDGVAATEQLIRETFGEVSVNMNPVPRNKDGAESNGQTDVATLRNARSSVRPPVEHTMG